MKKQNSESKMAVMPVKKTYACHGNTYDNFHDAAGIVQYS